MALSKRVRYEVLRRDDHACRYCGGRAPEVRLTIDHVVPVALGGGDDPTNLATACADCNAGKSSVAPDSPIVADVAADALRWGVAMAAAQAKMLADLDDDAKVVRAFLKVWESHGDWTMPGDFGDRVVSYYRSGLPIEAIEDAAFRASGARHVSYGQRFAYFCGICRNRVKELHDTAAALVDAEKVSD